MDLNESTNSYSLNEQRFLRLQSIENQNSSSHRLIHSSWFPIDENCHALFHPPALLPMSLFLHCRGTRGKELALQHNPSYCNYCINPWPHRPSVLSFPISIIYQLKFILYRQEPKYTYPCDWNIWLKRLDAGVDSRFNCRKWANRRDHRLR